jgi:hypothetical protein
MLLPDFCIDPLIQHHLLHEVESKRAVGHRIGRYIEMPNARWQALASHKRHREQPVAALLPSAQDDRAAAGHVADHRPAPISAPGDRDWLTDRRYPFAAQHRIEFLVGKLLPFAL